MASSVTANGQSTSVPSTIADPKYTAASQALPAAQVLAVVGEFEGLENGKAAEFSNVSSLLAAVPGDDFVEQIASLAFNPFSDPLVGAPNRVVLASTLGSTVAKGLLYDAYNTLSVSLKSRVYGVYGNFFAYTMKNNAVDTKLKDVVIYRQGETEPLERLGSGPVIEVSYSGTWATAILLAAVAPRFDSALGDVSGEVHVVITKALAEGANAVASDDQVAAGPVTFDPSTSTGNTINMTITGLLASGAPDTEVVQLANGSAAAKTSTKSWSRISNIAMEDTSYAGVVTASWTVRKITRQSAKNLAVVQSLLNDLNNVTAVIKNPRAGVLTLGDLDTLPSTDFKTVAAALRADSSEFVRLVNASSRFATAERSLPSTVATWTRLPTTATADGTAASPTLTVTDPTGVTAGDASAAGAAPGDAPVYRGIASAVVDGTTLTMADNVPVSFSGLPVYFLSVKPAGRPLAFSTGTPAAPARVFAGGTTGVTDATSRQAMRDALKLTQTAVIACMSLAADDISAINSHCIEMAGVGARECCGFYGAPSQASLDDIDALALQFNNRHMSLWTEDIRVVDSQGLRRWLDPRFQALQMAAGQCSVPIARPLNRRRPRVLETRSAAAWNGTKNANDLIKRGANGYSRDALGFMVTRAITSYRGSDDVNQTECSANSSVNWQIRDMRDFLQPVVDANSAEFYIDAIITLAIERGRRQVASKLITAFYENTVYAFRQGDILVVGYAFSPAVPTNFLILRPEIRPVRFEFSIV